MRSCAGFHAERQSQVRRLLTADSCSSAADGALLFGFAAAFYGEKNFHVIPPALKSSGQFTISQTNLPQLWFFCNVTGRRRELRVKLCPNRTD
jgi:hypothetical protein